MDEPQNICVKCGQIPARKGLTVCGLCSHKMYDRLLMWNKCVRCKRNSTYGTGRTICDACAEKMRQYNKTIKEERKRKRRQAWIDKGKCPDCRKHVDRTDFDKPCAWCYRMKWHKRYRVAMRARAVDGYCVYCNVRLTRQNTKTEQIGQVFDICDSCLIKPNYTEPTIMEEVHRQVQSSLNY